MQLYLPIAELTVNMFLFLGMGGAVGFLSGMFGVGGGFLLTPLLIFTGIPPAVAVATVTPQIVASSTSAAISYWRRRLIDEKMTLLLAAGGLVGSTLGVFTFRALRSVGQLDLIISLAYVVFLGFIGSIMLRESVRAILRSRGRRARARPAPGHHNWIHGLPLKMRFRRSKLYVSVIPIVALGAGIGFLGSVLGLGGGFIMVPALIYLLRVPTNVVIGTSLAYTLMTMAVATVLHATANKTVDIMLAFLLMVGGVIGAQFGAQVGQAMRGEQLRALLALLVLLVAIRVLLGLFLTPEEVFSLRIMGGARETRASPRLALLSCRRAEAAAAESLVSTLSDDAVEITSNFTGEQIVVFGAVRGAPDGEPGLPGRRRRAGAGAGHRGAREGARSRHLGEPHVARVQGRAVLLRHASERELQRRRSTPAELVQYRLGVAEPALRPGREPASRPQRSFAQALIDLKTKRGLYAERKSEVHFLAPSVFRTTFFLPSDIPTGDYRVSVYLFRDRSAPCRRDRDAGDRQGRLLRAHRPRLARLPASLRPRLRRARGLHRLARRRGVPAVIAGRERQSGLSAANAIGKSLPSPIRTARESAPEKSRANALSSTFSPPVMTPKAGSTMRAPSVAKARQRTLRPRPRTFAAGWRCPATSPSAAPARGSWRNVRPSSESSSTTSPSTSSGNSGSWLPVTQIHSHPRCSDESRARSGSASR